MDRERQEALQEFLAAVDQRLAVAPVVERRDQADRRERPDGKPFDAQRAEGPVLDAFAYWDSKTDPSDGSRP